MLCCLAMQPGQFFTRQTLLDTVWAEMVVNDAVLTVCIRELRRALGDDPLQPRYIETVHQRGYRFVAPVGRREAALPGDWAGASPAVPPAAPAAELVGWEAEMAQIQASLARARSGHRQVPFVTGEPGIGKTALGDACIAACAAQETVWVGWR